ncbi:phosphomannomutase/phosphoglucomutase [Marinobacter sp. S0848L]|uniref:phosphomannomutase/phosphoglucomutase n=1 Tax=Marinobacter sp. S0848L TaxID=2926423 RepID=UPI00248CF947|nr:phosphomannomutase/phosphoglucomutase [Marinobacter sp. S0848L]
MKFGKKKANDDAAKEQPVTDAPKAKVNRSRASNGLKKLSSVAASQALVVVLAGVISAALLHFLVSTPVATKDFERAVNVEANSAQHRLNHYLKALQGQVQAVANQQYVIDRVSGESDLRPLSRQLLSAVNGAAEVFVFPRRGIPRTGNSDSLLGFAGLELAQRAENGQPMLPDAFPRDNQWYLQFAAPVRSSVSKAVIGTVLVVFKADHLAPLLQVTNETIGGRLALVQTAAGSKRPVISVGSGNGAEVSRSLMNPDWDVVYQPGKTPAPPVSTVLLALLVLIPVLVAAAVVWLLLGKAQRSVREDVSAMTQWAYKVFSGERHKLPGTQWDMVASTGEVLSRVSQVVEKRVSQAKNTAAPKAAAAPASTKGEKDEPLFDSDSTLGMDMLDGDDDVLGLGSSDAPLFDEDIPDVLENTVPDIQVEAEIFRAYDIRGIVGETLSAGIVEIIGQAIGSEATERGVASLCIGYDGRHSSPELADALAKGVMSAGCNVIRVGAVPTPVLYFATHHLNTGSGVMVTGSHNPANYNGLKIMLGGETLSGDAIQKLYQRIQTGDFTSGQGEQAEEDVRRAYLDRIVGDIAVAAPLKVVVDAGNGIAGELAPILVEELGCEVVPLFCDIDGDFPNHHPDPGQPDNLQHLIAKVQEVGADIGIAFDGDGDRLGVVTNKGKIIWPDRLMMLFARDVVSRNPGADVLYDVKCSRRLAGVISEAGGRPVMWKTGHSLMKAKMKETGALLAGELSGHVFFGERWYGFDDGLYSAARLLEILGIEDRHSDEVFEDFPEDISTPELNVEVTESDKFAIIERLGEQGDFGDGNVSTIDGIRVDYPDGWGLCRASNTTPVLVLRFEAETEEALERIKTVFREQLQKVAPDLGANF